VDVYFLVRGFVRLLVVVRRAEVVIMVFTNVTTSPVDALQTVNDLLVVKGVPLFSVTVVVLLWVVVYLRSSAREGARVGLASASFFSALVGSFFVYLGLLPDISLMVVVALSLVSLIPLINR